jgi:long-chain acyl-CoA synthetase
LKHPKVSEAVAFGIPDPILGEDIKVAIVLQEGQQASEQEILDYCKNNLSKNLIPKSVQFLTELPKTAVGKIRRNVLKHQ